MRLGQRAAEHREVLREHVDEAPVDAAVAGHDAVPQHLLVGEVEVCGPVGDEPVQLHERSGVEQEIQALARGELALGVLLLDAVRPSPGLRFGPEAVELIESLL